MPKYTKTLKTRSDVNTMMEKKDLNKVILFTTKKDPPALYRALACTFRFKLKFYDIKADNEELTDHYGIDTFPSLLIQKSDTEWDIYDNPDEWDVETLITILMNSASPTEVYDYAMGGSSKSKAKAEGNFHMIT